MAAICAAASLQLLHCATRLAAAPPPQQRTVLVVSPVRKAVQLERIGVLCSEVVRLDGGGVVLEEGPPLAVLCRVRVLPAVVVGEVVVLALALHCCALGVCECVCCASSATTHPECTAHPSKKSRAFITSASRACTGSGALRHAAPSAT